LTEADYDLPKLSEDDVIRENKIEGTIEKL
jgi:hypothetical protein